MTYEAAISYLEQFIDYERLTHVPYTESEFKLERMFELLGHLGEPQQGLRCIHIAGTKGKGSTGAMIAAILQAAGHRTGIYSSPHLISFRERIRINGEMIPEPEVARLVDRIKPAVDATTKRKAELGALTFFELYTAVAFLYFAQQSVDWAVIEVGMGGRLDATNVVNPDLVVITPISLDHQAYLGSTLTEIAAEKAGIIKPDIPVVCAPQQPEVTEVIRQRAEACGAPLIVAADRSPLLEGINRGRGGETSLGMLGAHQLRNAAVAVAAIEALRAQGHDISDEAVRNGLASARLRGRFEVHPGKPTLVLDCAHNRLSARALREALDDYLPTRKVVFVLGFSMDKDIPAILEELAPRAWKVILTRPKNPRAASPKRLQKLAEGILPSVLIAPDVPAAVEQARRLASPDDVICITGSFYVVGEAMEALALRF